MRRPPTLIPKKKADTESFWLAAPVEGFTAACIGRQRPPVTPVPPGTRVQRIPFGHWRPTWTPAPEMAQAV